MTESITTIVVDAGPAVAIDRLDYVAALQSQGDLDLVLPEPVASELSRKPGLPGSSLPVRLRQEPVSGKALERLRQDRGSGPLLGVGELGLIALAEHLRTVEGDRKVISVIDDRIAWRFAHERWRSDRALTGSLGLLYLVYERGLTDRTVGRDIDLLRDAGYRVPRAEVDALVGSVMSMVPRGRDAARPLPAGEAWLARMRSAGLRRTRHAHPPWRESAPPREH